jgi:hypothetical protein
MREFLLPAVVALAVIGGIYYGLTHLTAARVYRAPEPATEAAPPPPASPKPEAHRPRLAKPVSKVDEPPAPAPAVKPAPAQVASVAKPMDPPPTGTPDQVKIGMDSTQVVQLLGKPDLTALSIQRGGLVETYVYKPKARETVSVIQIEDGRVVARR